jgi:hypothetical protein
MFHLIDRIYLAPDFMLDVHKDRIVISEENGYLMHEVILKVSDGLLYKTGKNVEEIIGKDPIAFFKDIINFSKSRDRSLYIYADKKSLPKIQAIWFKLMFEYPDNDTCYHIYNSSVHKFNLMYKSRLSSNSGARYGSHSINPSLITNEMKKAPDINPRFRRIFCSQNRSGISIEYLLATYLYNGQLKRELKDSIKKLLVKHFDEILLECKMIFLSQYTNEKFAEQIGLEKRYSFSNLDIFSDKSKVAEFFLSGRLYKTKELTKSSAKSNFRFDCLTSEDLETLKMYTYALGSYYSFNDSIEDLNDGIPVIFRDGHKWQFIECLTKDFSDDMLKKLLDLETNIDNANGSFYNTLLETVNGFTVQYILQLYHKKDFEKLKHFIVVK